MMPEAHYQKIAEELAVAFRGEKSQRDFSHSLGYSFNQAGKWEAGSTRIKWDDFFHLANTAGIPIESQFRRLFTEFNGDFEPLTTLQQIVKAMSRRELPWPRATVSRWTRGDAVPALTDVLRILDSHPAILLTWIAQMTDIKKIESLREKHAALTKRMDLVMSDPLCVYVNAALQLRVYQELEDHDENLLAEHSTCAPTHLRKVLACLLAADVISFDGRKYHPCPFDFSFATSRSLKVRSLTKYTTELAAERYTLLPVSGPAAKPVIASRGSVRAVAVSMEASKRIEDLLLKFHSEVGEIVAQDTKPKDGVQVILVHSFASNINSSGSPAAKA